MTGAGHDWFEVGCALTSIGGDDVPSGDHAVVATSEDGSRALFGAIDGLGHGDEAATASQTAESILVRSVDTDPVTTLETCHSALIRTRGAVMTLAWVDQAAGRLTWTGVGNVEGRLVRAPSPDHLEDRDERVLSLGGVVGYKLPRVRPTTLSVAPGDTLLFVTDGIEPSYGEAIVAGMPPQLLADRIMERHARGTDDALVLVVRLLVP